MTPEEQIVALNKQLALKDAKIGELQKKLEQFENPDVSEDDKKVLGVVANSDNGVSHEALAKESGFSLAKVGLHLTRLQKKGFILVHGGGSEMQRIKLDAPGVNFVSANNLL